MNDFERAKRFIQTHDWHFAKSMASIPHWYCLRSDQNDYDRFKWFVTFIRENSREGRFYSKTYRYFYLWGYKYWDMDPTPEVCDLVNRDQYKRDYIDETDFVPSYDIFYDNAVRDILAGHISGDKKVCDLCCGNGGLFEVAAGLNDYHGVDNRKQALIQLLDARPNLKGRLHLERVGNLSYENVDVIVSLNAERLDAEDIKRVVNSKKTSADVLLFSKGTLAPQPGLNLLKTAEFSLLTTKKSL